MKSIILIALLVSISLASQEVFADTEMTGRLKIIGVYSTEVVPQSYIFWFEDNQDSKTYKLNPYTVPPNVLDLGGQKVRIVVEDQHLPAANFFGPQIETVNVISVEKIELPDNLSAMTIPSPWRSVTLLSKYSDDATTPSENPIEFNFPQGVALDNSENLYVADSDTGSVNHGIQKFNSNGVFLEKFGSLCQLSTSSNCEDPDGGGPLELGDGQFLFPSDVAIDNDGNIIVADNNNNRVQKLDSSGTFLFKLGANGGDGTGGDGDGEFIFPFGVTTDSLNNIYVSDQFNGRIEKFDSSGNFMGWLGFCSSGVNCNLGNHTSMGFSCTAVTCSLPGNQLGNGQFNSPRGIAIDSSDNIYVADTSNHRIQKFDSSGSFLTAFGTSGSGDGQFSFPRAVAVDDSKIYVADTGNNRVQVFDSSGSFQFNFGSLGALDGQFEEPQGIEVDSSGNIFVGDTNNVRVQKFDMIGSFLSKIDTSPGLSHDAAYYQELFYDGDVSVNQYYNASSYDKFTLNGEVNGWKTLPKTKSTYLNNVDTFNLLLTDALALHEPDVDFCNPSPVNNVILVMNGQVSDVVNSAFGSVNEWVSNLGTGDGCSVTLTVVWDPDNGGFFCCGQTLDRGIGVTAHEIGHNLGFYHTPLPPGNWRNEFNPAASDPYHDPYSLMSTNRDQESPSALITAQRNATGWMDAGNIQTVSQGSSATISLDFINEPEDGINPQMIVVPLGDGSLYTIEAHEDEIWNDTPQDRTGAVMYKYFPSGNQYSYLSLQSDKDAKYSLVATNGTDTTSQIDQAILEISETYEDNTNSVTVTTQTVDSTFITVFVSNNASSCTPLPGQNWVITESCTLTGDVTADMNITIQDNSVLTIPDGFTVFFDPGTYSITVISGSGILVEQGGSIQTTP